MDASSRRHQMNLSFISRVPLLSELTDSERAVIADALQPVYFRAGTIIIQQGSPGHVFFMIQNVRLVYCHVGKTYRFIFNM